MSTGNLYGEAVSRLIAQSDAIGRLALDPGAFAAVVAAFESKDPNAFRWVLERLERLPDCELICEWVEIKLCVLRCIEVCGPPPEKAAAPDLHQFVRAIVKLASDDKLLGRVVDAVSCGNAEEYRAALAELKLEEFCHLICRWVCSVIDRRICEIICSPDFVARPDAVSDIRDAARVMARVMANEKAFDAINNAAVAFDCENLRSVINQSGFAGDCEVICWVICFWRCFWVCSELCERPSPILTGAYAVEEARAFALAARQLAGHSRELGDLVHAVRRRDRKAFSAIVDRFGLGPYCEQLCAWVCSVTCAEFCICVCGNPALQPWFTKVGNFLIYPDVDAATGKTNKSKAIASLAYGGGPNFAFTGALELDGFCPSTSPTMPGVQMQYRFLYAKVSTTLSAAINAAQTSIAVASSAGVPATPFNASICIAGGTGETVTVTGVLGTNWTVIRGQNGTTAAAVGAGTMVWINPTPITGDDLVSQVVAATRQIAWPKENLITMQAEAVLDPTTQQEVRIAPPALVQPDPIPPAPGAPYVAPSPHYLTPDANGWIVVDLNAIGGGFQTMMGFETAISAVVGGCSLAVAPCIGTPGGAPAGSVVTAANQGTGTDLTIIFEATRVGAATVDYSNSLCKIHVNNWSQVSNLWFNEFATGCCTPIDSNLGVQFTVDHEEMSAGAWSLVISSCAFPAPHDITPPNPTAGVTFTAGGRGAAGTVVEDTSTWSLCSYTVHLYTRPGLTTGVTDASEDNLELTFCICGH